jgi:hypothetical protein
MLCVMRAWVIAACLVLFPSPALAKEIVVAAGTKIQAGIDAAMPGDVVVVKAGTYAEGLKTSRPGVSGMPITLRGEPGALISNKTTLLTVNHAFFTVEGLVFDAQYAVVDAIIVEDAGTSFTLRASEVKNATKDCIDLRSPRGVLIEKSKIHHCLNATGGRTDAHGVVAGAVRDLVIRDTEIHTFSGDAFQLDPDRLDAGWDNVTVEGCTLWLAPLPAAENGFAAGAVPGENAIDTKTADTRVEPGHLTIRNTVAYGFRAGLLTNMAAFNLKENVDAVLDRVTVYNSEIALRLRGPTRSPRGARVRAQNLVVWDVDKAVRYEDNIVEPTILNATFGAKVTTAFQEASSSATKLSIKNLLLLGASLPAVAAGGSNLAVMDSAFVNVATNDYHLAKASPAIDTGESIATVTVDRDGAMRPVGAAYDRGAYEWSAAGPPPDASPPVDSAIPESDSGTTPANDAGTTPNPSAPTEESGGCGCRVAHGSNGSAATILLLLVMVTRRRLRTAAVVLVPLALLGFTTGYIAPRSLQSSYQQWRECIDHHYEKTPTDLATLRACSQRARRVFVATSLIPWLRADALSYRSKVDYHLYERELTEVSAMTPDRARQRELSVRNPALAPTFVSSTRDPQEILRLAGRRELIESENDLESFDRSVFLATAWLFGADGLEKLPHKPPAWKCWKHAPDAVDCGKPDFTDPRLDEIGAMIDGDLDALLKKAISKERLQIDELALADARDMQFDRWYFARTRSIPKTSTSELFNIGKRALARATDDAHREDLRLIAWSFFFASATRALRQHDIPAAKKALVELDAVNEQHPSFSLLLRLSLRDPEGVVAYAASLDRKLSDNERAAVTFDHARALSELGRFAEAYALVVRVDEAITHNANDRVASSASLQALSWMRLALAHRTGAPYAPLPYLDSLAHVDIGCTAFYRYSDLSYRWKVAGMAPGEQLDARARMLSRMHASYFAPATYQVAAAMLDRGDVEVWLDWHTSEGVGARAEAENRAEAARFRGDTVAAAEWAQRAQRAWAIADADPDSPALADLGI